ncbi:MAG: SDR family NAD(P)-dependent oxidoreductase [Oscillospiraceae bacterium]
MELSRKSIVVTGANRGIGLEIVKTFASNGYDVWACMRNHNEDSEKIMEEYSQKYSVEIKPVYFDMSSEEEINSGIKSIIAEKKNIDVLVNNAGIAHGGLMTMTPISKIREVYDVNVFAQIQVTQLIARKMMKQKSGCIINMCSAGGIETSPGYIAYGSSKAAMIWITKSLAKELAGYNIRVNGIAPGLIDTDMGKYKSNEEIQKVFERMSIKRMGKSEEIAKAALYIASDDAAYMTGQIMVLDGGRT